MHSDSSEYMHIGYIIHVLSEAHNADNHHFDLGNLCYEC